MDEKKVKEAISNIENFRSMLEEAAKDLVGNIDDGTMAYYSSLVRKFDSFTGMLKEQINNLDGDERQEVEEPPVKDVLLKDFKNETFGISTRAFNALYRSGISTLKDLTYVPGEELKNIINMGKTTLEEVDWFCKEQNIRIGSNKDRTPHYEIGDEVVTLFYTKTIDGLRRTVRKGSKAVVIDIEDNEYVHGYYLRNYVCRVVGGQENGYEILLSPGEIKEK